MSEKRDAPRVLSIWPSPLEGWVWVKTGPDTAVPSRFNVRIELAEPDLTIAMTISVGTEGRALVREFALSPRDFSTTVTTRMLRKVPLERLLRESLADATRPVATARPDIHPNAFQMPGDPDSQAWVSPDPRAGRRREAPKDRIARAAEIYQQAVASGSRAPAEAVAQAMHYSRATAARDIRAARERGILAPAGGTSAGENPTTKLTPPSSDAVSPNPVWRRFDDHEKWAPMEDVLNRPTGLPIFHPGIASNAVPDPVPQNRPADAPNPWLEEAELDDAPQSENDEDDDTR